MVTTRPSSKAKGRIVRNPTNTTFSTSCSLAELERINKRADNLGLDRSAYILALCRQDWARREFVLVPKDQLESSKPV